ncbi:unnamed protein product [Schistosoma margrebowiei]|uniref:Uncharacterized protein n=1 Tax=Schistosoma margrebowiei TaxID=48269 RepID=A0A183LTA4_9TREM|nr:unnamed protein product [Schistosoma margrebowiei]
MQCLVTYGTIYSISVFYYLNQTSKILQYI